MPKRSPSILGGRGRGARQAWRIFRTRLVQRWFQRLLTGFSVSQHRPQRIDRCTAAWLKRKRRNDPARARSNAKRCETRPAAPGRDAAVLTHFKEGEWFTIGKRTGKWSGRRTGRDEGGQ